MKPFVLVLAVGLLITLAHAVPAIGQDENPPQPGEATADVIRVKGVSAVKVAHVLDEAFNTARETRVIVFAIPLSDSLFVWATRDDLAVIRAMLRSG